MKRVKKSVIAMSAALVMLLSLAISIVPTADVEASNPEYPILLAENNTHDARIYIKDFSQDLNGNLVFNFYCELDDDADESYAVFVFNSFVVNDYNKIKTSVPRKEDFNFNDKYLKLERGDKVRDAIILSSKDMKNQGIDIIKNIQVTLGSGAGWSGTIHKTVDVPISNSKVSADQYQGNGVYNINGVNKNVLFGLVLDDYNYERMLPIYTIDGSNTMYRLYNGYSGEHFYTSNYSEATYLTGTGWSYEGAAWFAPANGDEVYRLYNAYSTEHHYTKDVGEKDYLVGSGWNYEGVGWKTSNSGIPVYRLFNPNNPGPAAHHYTTDENERNVLISSGWNDEGIGWYGV